MLRSLFSVLLWVRLSLGVGLMATTQTLALAQVEDAEADRIYTEAAKLFEGGWFDRAEKELAQFRAGFPHSQHRAEAALLQAESRFQLKDFKGAIDLLQTQLANAGPLQDQYVYWRAEAQLQLGQLVDARNSYRELLHNFPVSALRVEAAFGEAFTDYKLGDTAQTVALLQSPLADFQLASKASTNQTAVIRVNFLLAEALLTQKDFRAAEQVLTQLAGRGLTPDLEWQRGYLLTRAAMADDRNHDALVRVTNLVGIAQSKSNAVLQANSLILKAEILEDEHQPESAAQTYEQITKLSGVSAEHVRRALLKLAEIETVGPRLSNTVTEIDATLKQNPLPQEADLLRLSLGEAYLRRFYNIQNATNSAVYLAQSTNLLHAAQAQFDAFLAQFTNSVYLGTAFLNRGWCTWEEAQIVPDPAKLRISQESFHAAAERLPKSLDQVTARFKAADCLFLLKDYTNAAAQYRELCTQYAHVPEARTNLFDHALYQWLQSSLMLNDVTTARSALDQLLTNFASSPWAAQGSLLLARALVQAGNFKQAQEAFFQFQTKFPDSPLLPQVRLAEADAFARQQKWPEAISHYDNWLTQYTNHPAGPQAQFNRAWCYAQSGSLTNAFRLLTNFVQQFPGSSYAALGQLWIGDYFLNLKDNQNAEYYYQLPFKSTNSIPTAIGHQATLMAAKAAFFRDGYNDARRYLTNLVNDTHLSPEIGGEAFYMLGDIELTAPYDSTNKLKRFEFAINDFGYITNFYAATRYAPLALGRIADCHLQLAALYPSRYEMATNTYWQVIRSPLADLATRSQAEVGLGKALEKMAEQRTNRLDLLQEALTHYLNVAYGKAVPPGQQLDAFWMSEAALAAASLAADKLQQFDQAEKLYLELNKTLPAFSAKWEARLKALRQQRAGP